ncbi:hypothetical protein Sdia_08080 [Streptomyces diastaticus subsp. diastaticus]|uniref:Uncharacterized protein n=1 Tax=Streptomyces diastaticus subsp. diastaticus TaxID=68040 RepID=A0ABQ1CIU3_STRDI|nr:hypothetical protein Sdia_08080 [Streptomyces diastaticus subsp. diastaticus]
MAPLAASSVWLQPFALRSRRMRAPSSAASEAVGSTDFGAGICPPVWVIRNAIDYRIVPTFVTSWAQVPLTGRPVGGACPRLRGATGTPPPVSRQRPDAEESAR